MGGSIGDYIIVARRKGESWFVGALVDDSATLDIPLTFLGEGTFTAKVYKEDTNQKKRVARETIDVTSDTVLTATMSSGSGYAAHIFPRANP